MNNLKFNSHNIKINKKDSYRIADKINISKENMFFQYIYLGSGGQVKKHYDVGLPG